MENNSIVLLGRDGDDLIIMTWTYQMFDLACPCSEAMTRTLSDSRWLVRQSSSDGSISQTLKYLQEVLQHPQFHGLSLVCFHQQDQSKCSLRWEKGSWQRYRVQNIWDWGPEVRRKKENERVVVMSKLCCASLRWLYSSSSVFHTYMKYNWLHLNRKTEKNML